MLRDSYTTACGGRLVLPPKTREHLLAHPEVGELLAEVTRLVKLPHDGSFYEAEIDLGRVLGHSGRVATTPITIYTTTLFAQRVARDKPSRVFVGEGPETTTVAIRAFAGRERDTYVLLSAWRGGLAPYEPWDRALRSSEAVAATLEFWCRNALVHDPAVMGEPFESTWREILSR